MEKALKALTSLVPLNKKDGREFTRPSDFLYILERNDFATFISFGERLVLKYKLEPGQCVSTFPIACSSGGLSIATSFSKTSKIALETSDYYDHVQIRSGTTNFPLRQEVCANAASFLFPAFSIQQKKQSTLKIADRFVINSNSNS